MYPRSRHRSLTYIAASLLASLLCVAEADAQRRPDRLGLHYGYAAQDRFPFGNTNYAYRTHGLKAQVAWVVRERERLDLELLLEPSVYAAEHRLLAFGFIKPEDTPRYEAERARFLAGRRFVEVALNVGLLARWRLGRAWSAYGLVSVGPMVSGRATERLRRGFAFSDVAGAGVSYRWGRWQADARATLRHNSNANLARPNHGHNSAGAEVGLGRWLGRER